MKKRLDNNFIKMYTLNMKTNNKENITDLFLMSDTDLISVYRYLKRVDKSFALDYASIADFILGVRSGNISLQISVKEDSHGV